MDNTYLVLLGVLALTQIATTFAIVSLFRKVADLMATQAELQNALDVTGTDLDSIKEIVDRLVAAGGPQNVMSQAQLDAFVTLAQSNRTKADAIVESVRTIDPGVTGTT